MAKAGLATTCAQFSGSAGVPLPVTNGRVVPAGEGDGAAAVDQAHAAEGAELGEPPQACFGQRLVDQREAAQVVELQQRIELRIARPGVGERQRLERRLTRNRLPVGLAEPDVFENEHLHRRQRPQFAK